MTCSNCAVAFDGFKVKLYRNTHCKTCYNQAQYAGQFRKVTLESCTSCGKTFDEVNVIRSHSNQCNKCYTKLNYANRKRGGDCSYCGGVNTTSTRFCRLCKKKFKGDFEFKIPPTKVTKKGVKIPKDIQIEVTNLLIKARWGFLNEVDNWRIVHYYLMIFESDVELDSYPATSQLRYMLGVLKNLISQI